MNNNTEDSNTFERTLRELRGGAALNELSTRLAELVFAVRLTGKGGRLRLELDVKPASRGSTTCVMVEDDIALKLPKAEKATSIFYTTEQNQLQRNDPNQREFQLRELPAPHPVELRTVAQPVDAVRV